MSNSIVLPTMAPFVPVPQGNGRSLPEGLPASGGPARQLWQLALEQAQGATQRKSASGSDPSGIDPTAALALYVAPIIVLPPVGRPQVADFLWTATPPLDSHTEVRAESDLPVAGHDKSPVPAIPVRMHAEESPSGTLVWLGLDGTASSIRDQAAVMVAEMQRTLDGQGKRLATVVCNGKVIFQAPDSTPSHFDQET